MGPDDARPLNRSRLPLALLLLGVASAAFDVGCVLVKTPFLRPGVTAGDAIETAGVFVVLALFAWVARLAAPGSSVEAAAAAPGGALFGIAAAAFAFGHGVHVAANSLHDLAARSGAGDPTGLFDFWDERAGHYLVDSARVLFAAALTHGAARAAGTAGSAGARPAGGGPAAGATAAAIAGGAAYGFTLFASAVEGQTVPLILPASALYAAWSALARGRSAGAGSADGGGGSRGAAEAVRLFFTAAAWTALLFFAIWGVWQGGFPEFTRAGILRSAP